MPNTKGNKPVTLYGRTLQSLKSNYDKRLKEDAEVQAKTFTRFVNDVIVDYLAKEEFLSRILPFMSKIGMTDNVLYIKDSRKPNNIAQIYLHDGRLFCELDKTFSCDHINYAFALPEVSRLEIKKGKV